MKEQKVEGGKADCYYHPEQIFVGICPLCLYEKLLLLSSSSATSGRSNNFRKTTIDDKNTKPSVVVFPKIFASLFDRHDDNEYSGRHRGSRKPENYLDSSSTITHDDSYISIQFEKNGDVSWEKKKVTKMSLDHYNIQSKKKNNNKILNNKGERNVQVEHAEKSRAKSLRWPKRIGQLFHIKTWKKSNKECIPCGK